MFPNFNFPTKTLLNQIKAVAIGQEATVVGHSSNDAPEV